MNKVAGLTTLILVSFLCGCSSGNTSGDKSVDSNKGNPTRAIVVGQRPSENFKTVFQKTGDFLEWRRLARKLHSEGKYEDAISAMEHGFEAGFGAADKGIATEQIAQSYEALHDYELAANFYEASGKYSMNPKLTDELNAKAAQMRELFKTRVYQDMKNPPEEATKSKT